MKISTSGSPELHKNICNAIENRPSFFWTFWEVKFMFYSTGPVSSQGVSKSSL
jgi:hypothetical protein